MARILRSLAIAAAVVLSASTSSAPGQPAAPPAVVGVVKAGAIWTLRPLNPRTLAPIPGTWSRPVARDTTLVRSPLGSGVAVGWLPRRAGVVDARTGRVVHRFEEAGAPDSTVYWLGPELPFGGSRQFLVEDLGTSCSSGGCGNEYEVLGAGVSEGWVGSTVAVLRRRLVIAVEKNELVTLGAPQPQISDLTRAGIKLPGLPRSAPVRVVADVATDRLFAISSAGVVARITKASGRASVSYHRVALNGRQFEATWAGQGRIALWGADGLGTIDTRTWTTKAVAPPATGAVATKYGIAAWGGQGGGVDVYRPDGTLRFNILPGSTVRSVEPVGRYLYVRADHRYSVDLVAGRVLGQARDDARLALPSFLLLP